MKIYTKVGDGGDTYLFGGGKVRKDHPRVNAYGDVDELNSVLGWAASLTQDLEIREVLESVQKELFVLGADLATPPDARPPKAVSRIGAKEISRLEKAIDKISKKLSPLTHFILPGGSSLGAALHFCLLYTSVSAVAEAVRERIAEGRVEAPELAITFTLSRDPSEYVSNGPSAVAAKRLEMCIRDRVVHATRRMDF